MGRGRLVERSGVLEVRLLGTPEFVYDGTPFRFNAPPRTLPLLGWLLLHRPGQVQRDSVAFAFWPDALEEDARSDLRRHLYYLGKALPPKNGEPWLLADKKTIAWNERAGVAFDVVEFERLIAQEATLEEAVRLYRGPLLQGIDDDWIEPERERLQNLAESALLRLIARDSADAPERAIAHAQHLLRIDPWREDAIRALVSLRHRSGDRAGALREYRDFAARLRQELDVTPMPETTAVYEAVAHADALLPVRAPLTASVAARTNLPAHTMPLVGRKGVLDDVRALLETTPLATLVGTGGVGKTRVAIDVGRAALESYADGVWFADCGPLGDSSLVITAIGAALGIAQATERPEAATIVAALRRKSLLLIVDNCEHVVGEVARIVTHVMGECPHVRVLATSREPLGVRGERVYRVPSLDVPEAFEVLGAERARQFGAVALFEERAAAADPAFVLGPNNVSSVVDICRRLDGIALAIELAAARITVLTPAELLRRLEQRFRVLAGGERTALPRQRTMRATIDWSWELCDDAERVALRRVAVFAGGWTLEAAEAICFRSPLEFDQAIALLGSLVERSLVVAESGPVERRYRLLESIRHYALEKLEEAGEREALLHLHAAYFANFGTRIDDAYETMPDKQWYALATSELDDVRAALSWTLEGGGDATLGARLASAYGTVWEYGSSRTDRRSLDLAYERLDRLANDALAVRLSWQIAAISHADERQAEWVAVAVRDRGDARTRASALCWLAGVYVRLGRFEEAETALEEATALQDPVHGPKAHAALLHVRGELAAAQGLTVVARAHFERAIAIAGACGALGIGAATRVALAEAAFAAGDLAGARVVASEARDAIVTTFGHTIAYADVLGNLAAYAIAQGDLLGARDDAQEALQIARDLEFPARAAVFIEHLASVAALRGQLDRAAFLLGFADAERTRRDEPRGVTERPGYERTLALLRQTFEGRDLASRLARGAIAGVERVVAEALTID